MITATFTLETRPYALTLVEEKHNTKCSCKEIYTLGLPKRTIDVALECIYRYSNKDQRAVAFHILTLDLDLPEGE